jgi:hypothetical protein
VRRQGCWRLMETTGRSRGDEGRGMKTTTGHTGLKTTAGRTGLKMVGHTGLKMTGRRMDLTRDGPPISVKKPGGRPYDFYRARGMGQGAVPGTLEGPIVWLQARKRIFPRPGGFGLTTFGTVQSFNLFSRFRPESRVLGLESRTNRANAKTNRGGALH